MQANLQACGGVVVELARSPELKCLSSQGAAAVTRQPGNPQARSELVAAVREVRRAQQAEDQILIGVGMFSAAAVLGGLADTLQFVEQWDGFARIVRQLLG